MCNCPRVKRVLIIITCTTWLFKSMTERRETGIHSAVMFCLKLVVFVSDNIQRRASDRLSSRDFGLGKNVLVIEWLWWDYREEKCVVFRFIGFFLSFFSFILALFFLTFSFLFFVHLHVQPFLFLSYFNVQNKLCVLRVKLPMSVL